MDKLMIHKQSGFTIVELLIVIVVIGILASITIVAFSGIQNRGYDTSVTSDITALSKKLEIARADTGYYPTASSVQSGVLNYTANKSALPTNGANNRNLGICAIAGTSNDRFVVFALSKSGNWFTRTSGGELIKETGAWPASHSTLCTAKGINSTDVGVYYVWGSETGNGAASQYWASWVK